MIVSNSELLKSFSRYLKLEKGASDNTIDGYLHDVVKLFQYVSPESKPTIDQLVDADITQFTRHRHTTPVAGPHLIGTELVLFVPAPRRVYRREPDGTDRRTQIGTQTPRGAYRRRNRFAHRLIRYVPAREPTQPGYHRNDVRLRPAGIGTRRVAYLPDIF